MWYCYDIQFCCLKAELQKIGIDYRLALSFIDFEMAFIRQLQKQQ